MTTELIANSPTPGTQAAITTLAAAITSTTATTITTAAAAPTALQGGQFRIVVDSEIMLVTAGQTGTSWTVTRGNNLAAPDTCTAATHSNGASVYHDLTAGALDARYLTLSGGTMAGAITAPEFSASGLTGATAASRYVGATASGAPVSGTFAVGDFVIDQTGKIWVCTTAGTPGTWTQIGGSGGSGAAWGIGTAASRPTASTFGSGLYFATDTGEVSFSDGTSWYTLQQTSNGTFTVGSVSGSTYTQIGPSGPAGSGGIYFRGPNQFLKYASNFALEYGGNLGVSGVGAGLRVAEGTNAKQGTATLVAGTVTVSNTSVTTTSRIFLTIQSPGGTVGAPYVSARTAGTSFTITSTSATDTSTVAYEIFEAG